MTQNERIAVALAEERMARRPIPAEKYAAANQDSPSVSALRMWRVAAAWSRVLPDVFGDLSEHPFGRLDCGALVK